MNTTDTQALPAPPSLIKALRDGFDAIANHIGLILFPLALDLFLWFGPQLRLSRLASSFFDRSAAIPEFRSPEMAEMIGNSREMWMLLLERYNLSSALRSYPIGIPSLMVAKAPIQLPWGGAYSIEIPSFTVTLGLWLLFTLTGLVVGTLYFGLVAQAALSGQLIWQRSLKGWPNAAIQVLLLALVWFVLILGISLPFGCMLSMFLFSGFGLGRYAVFILLGLVAWLMLPLIFSPHGIFVYGLKAWTSIREGMRLTRLTLPSTGLFLVIALVLSEGLDVLWSVPMDGSWWNLVGMAGHAFVTTALLAASFVYYHDAQLWIQRMTQKAKLSTIK
jgi:hypothetical protein